MKSRFPICIVAALLVAPACGPRHGPPIYPVAKSNVIVAAAREQLSWGTRYDSRYVKLAYPGGDVPKDRGVCTDVVVRAFRAAGVDLQVLVHDDVVAQGGNPDTNIDHRRCPKMMGFLERQGKKLGTGAEGADLPEWKPGDIVFWKMSGGKDHVGIVSDVKTSGGLPYVIHNAGTPAEEDALTSWQIVGHFRYPKAGADTLKPKPENRT